MLSITAPGTGGRPPAFVSPLKEHQVSIFPNQHFNHFTLFVCVCVCVWMQVFMESKRRFWILWSWSEQEIVSAWCDCWELNSGPLKEQSAFNQGAIFSTLELWLFSEGGSSCGPSSVPWPQLLFQHHEQCLKAPSRLLLCLWNEWILGLQNESFHLIYRTRWSIRCVWMTQWSLMSIFIFKAMPTLHHVEYIFILSPHTESKGSLTLQPVS